VTFSCGHILCVPRPSRLPEFSNLGRPGQNPFLRLFKSWATKPADGAPDIGLFLPEGPPLPLLGNASAFPGDFFFL